MRKKEARLRGVLSVEFNRRLFSVTVLNLNVAYDDIKHHVTAHGGVGPSQSFVMYCLKSELPHTWAPRILGIQYLRPEVRANEKAESTD